MHFLINRNGHRHTPPGRLHWTQFNQIYFFNVWTSHELHCQINVELHVRLGGVGDVPQAQFAHVITKHDDGTVIKSPKDTEALKSKKEYFYLFFFLKFMFDKHLEKINILQEELNFLNKLLPLIL